MFALNSLLALLVPLTLLVESVSCQQDVSHESRAKFLHDGSAEPLKIAGRVAGSGAAVSCSGNGHLVRDLHEHCF